MGRPLAEIRLTIEETLGIDRHSEPVSIGVPFPEGLLMGEVAIGVVDGAGKTVPTQTGVLDRWPDGSAKWVLLDFLASVQSRTSNIYTIQPMKLGLPAATQGVHVRQGAESYEIDTGKCVFSLNRKDLFPVLAEGDRGELPPGGEYSRFVLRDYSGNEHEPINESCEIESAGPVRATIRLQGVFAANTRKKGKRACRFTCRLSFFYGHSFWKMDLSVLNPAAAKHPGGMWDLGDRGSILLKDLTLHLRFESAKNPDIRWKVEPGSPWARSGMGPLEIYQDSSGGKNWNSTNHVNRFGKVTTSFSGYRVYDNEKVVHEGKRANPVVSLDSREGYLSAGVPWFWQNFPKSIRAERGVLSIGLFPDRCKDLYELQGGEQKTHTVFLLRGNNNSDDNLLDWIHEPLIPIIDPDYISGTGVFPYMVSLERDQNEQYKSLVSGAVNGSTSFFSRREIIDEYGWRNFGDLYADHETAYYQGQQPLISHYNNQYDPICGAVLQFARSGDIGWFRLAQDMASHMLDIDIYHTEFDKAAFNGGIFWHTDHYTDAATATHRTYSRKTKEIKNLKRYGGGPSNEHLYTTGLLYYYYLTGNIRARETVAALGNWVLASEDGSRTPFRMLSRGETGAASQTAERNYHGPGRGAGNSINALIDAFVATKCRKYLDKAEHLIRRCIHPRDDIFARNLMNHELRWSYTAFLQYLGKYLDLKVSLDEQDFMFHYSRESLIHYASWMLENEIPFLQCLNGVEYPTETWIVHDLRKSNVFHFAAKYTEGKQRGKFLEKAGFFFSNCFSDLESFATRSFTRPLVMMMNYGIVDSYFQNYPETCVVSRPHNYDFGQPQVFRSQRTIAEARAKMIAILGLFLLGTCILWDLFGNV